MPGEIILHERCKVRTNKDHEKFVGIQYKDGDINAFFPVGYHLSDDKDEKTTRDDLLLLIKVLSKACTKRDGKIVSGFNELEDPVTFPIQAYLWIINDFSEHGYYTEQENCYIDGKSGKINWNRTIKTKMPYTQDGSPVYLSFVVRKSKVQLDNLITRIHRYCVYESFEKMGWICSDYMPPKPDFAFQPEQQNALISFLQSNLNTTFNTRLQILFRCMIAIIRYNGDPNAPENFTYGVYKFEDVWEKMIDSTYGVGEQEKMRYYPHTRWHLKENPDPIEETYPDTRNGKKYKSDHRLKPDTIMYVNKDVYILDAKYYSYCDTEPKNPHYLPWADSIPKQIDYAEFAEMQTEDDEKHNGEIYNAFILPFDSEKENKPVLDYIGWAEGEWKSNSEKKYNRVQGFFMDTKYLMQNYIDDAFSQKNSELAAEIKEHSD